MTDITFEQIPIGRYEFVTVSFGAANTDTTVPYTVLRSDDKSVVRWIDVSPSEVCTVYKGGQPFGANYIVLRCNVANYTTRLMLFTERI